MSHLHASKSNQAVQAEQQWSRSFNSQIGPLPSSFDAQMGTALFKGGFQRPPMHKSTDNRFGRKRLISAKQGLDRAFARRIASQHPTDGQRRMADAIPQRGPRTPFNLAASLAVP